MKMFEVNIYLETSLKGPIVKDGWYAAVLEYKSKVAQPPQERILGGKRTLHTIVRAYVLS